MTWRGFFIGRIGQFSISAVARGSDVFDTHFRAG